MESVCLVSFIVLKKENHELHKDFAFALYQESFFLYFYQLDEVAIGDVCVKEIRHISCHVEVLFGNCII